MGHSWRRQSQRKGGSLLSQTRRDCSGSKVFPLLRLQGERIYQNQGVFDVISPNMFAGSILDLQPDTAYEARFVLSDPDGIDGPKRKDF